MRAICSVMLLFALLSWSASAQPVVVNFFPIVHAPATPLESADALKTTAEDRTLHRQQLAHSEFARLDAPLNITKGNKTYAIMPEHLMFATRRARGVFARKAEDGDSVSFCTYDNTFTGRNAIGRSMEMPICLIDDDGDGAFDLAYAATDFDGLGSTLIGDFGVRVPTPTRYTLVQEESRNIAELAIKFSPPGMVSRGEIFLALINEFGERRICESFQFPSVLPASVMVQGAEIEVLAIKNRTMSYRVKSGFETVDLPQFRLEPENGDC